MSVPEVDVIIAVHTPQRDITRPVNSILRGTEADVRVTVVCHNTPVAGIHHNLGRMAEDSRIRLVALSDGIGSPGGPFNHGLSLAEAPFTAVVGSDDELEHGAIDSWLRVARGSNAAVVIARVRHSHGAVVPSPPTRPLRRKSLDGVSDRLSYRSAPLGLVSRQHFPTLRFAEGVRTGEDVIYVTGLWFSSLPIAYDRSGPAYVIHDDGAERVTTLSPPVQQDLEFLAPLLSSEQFGSLTDAQQHSLLVKIVRSTLFGLLVNRPDSHSWPASERNGLAEATKALRACLASTKLGERTLSRNDLELLDAASDPRRPTGELLRLSDKRRRFTSWGSLATGDLRDLLRRESPLRFAAASVLARL